MRDREVEVRQDRLRRPRRIDVAETVEHDVTEYVRNGLALIRPGVDGRLSVDCLQDLLTRGDRIHFGILSDNCLLPKSALEISRARDLTREIDGLWHFSADRC